MTQLTTIPAPPRRQRRRWRRWLTASALFIGMIAGMAGTWWYLVSAAERDFRAALAETDQLDPGWRFADIQAHRAAGARGCRMCCRWCRWRTRQIDCA